MNSRLSDILGMSRELLAASAAKLWGWGSAWKIFDTLASSPASLIYLPPTHLHLRVVFLIPSSLIQFPFSCFHSHAARSLFPDFCPLGRREACPFLPLQPEPPAAAFRSQGTWYNSNAIALRMRRLMALGYMFRLFRSSPC